MVQVTHARYATTRLSTNPLRIVGNVVTVSYNLGRWFRRLTCVSTVFPHTESNNRDGDDDGEDGKQHNHGGVDCGKSRKIFPLRPENQTGVGGTGMLGVQTCFISLDSTGIAVHTGPAHRKADPRGPDHPRFDPRYLQGAPMWTGPSCTPCWPWACSSSPPPRPGRTCTDGNNLSANQTRGQRPPKRPKAGSKVTGASALAHLEHFLHSSHACSGSQKRPGAQRHSVLRVCVQGLTTS